MVTTIQLSEDLKKKLSSFGSKGETYEQILSRIYDLAVKEQLRDFMMSEEYSVPVEEALKKAEAKYGKSNNK